MNEIDLSRVDLNLLVVFEVLMDTRNVTATARRIGRTQSAVSHALGRLRQQLDDPLLVRVGGRMQPSPFAEVLIEDVRPLLRGIRRVIAPRDAFDPATSDRVFRVAMPTLPHVIADVSAAMAAEAPDVRIEWLQPHQGVYAALSEGGIDLAHLAGTPRLPEGLESEHLGSFTLATFARADHPVWCDWGLEGWQRYPHLMVNVTRALRNPFPGADAGQPPPVRVMIPDPSAAAAILSRSDLLGTFPAILMARDMDRFGLRAARPPLVPPPVPVRFFWSARLAQDEGGVWLRRHVIESYRRCQAEAEDRLAERLGEGRS